MAEAERYSSSLRIHPFDGKKKEWVTFGILDCESNAIIDFARTTFCISNEGVRLINGAIMTLIVDFAVFCCFYSSYRRTILEQRLRTNQYVYYC
jgi:hypothetical protein